MGISINLNLFCCLKKRSEKKNISDWAREKELVVFCHLNRLLFIRASSL